MLVSDYSGELHRVVHGVFFEDSSDYSRGNKGGDGVFEIYPFWFEGKRYRTLFYFATMEFVSSKRLEQSTAILGLKRDLLFDLQSKAANHVNRLGNFMLH